MVVDSRLFSLLSFREEVIVDPAPADEADIVVFGVEDSLTVSMEECFGDWLCTSGGTKPSFMRFFCFIRRF